MRARQQLLCLLLVFPALAGCGKAPAASDAPRPAEAHRGPPRTLPAATVIYTPGGSPQAGALETLVVQPGSGQRFVVMREWVRKDEKGRPDRARLTRLDLASGRAQVLRDLGEENPHSWGGDFTCARNGRIALGEGGRLASRIVLREPDGKWRPIVNSSKLAWPLAWSPDSRSLLYATADVARFEREGGPGAALTVATEVAGTETFRQQRLPDLPIVEPKWGADGSVLFAMVLASRATDHPALVSIAWPSRTVKTLLTGVWPSFDVAEDTGIAMALVPEGRRYRIWRVQSGKAPERTLVSVDSLTALSVSPAGRYLAVVLSGSTRVVGQRFAVPTEDGGVVVYDTVDGSEFRVSDTVGKRVGMLHWVLGDGALIFTVLPADAIADDLGHQLWLVHMPWGA